MAERDRQQGLEDHGPALPVQPERDREQPAHRRIDAVEGAEPGEREPGPEIAHRDASAVESTRPGNPTPKACPRSAVAL